MNPKTHKKNTVFVVDDHPIFRKGLCSLLEDEEDIELVGEAGDGQSAIDLIREIAPEVVVMDISMPGLNGIEATEHIVSEFPDTKVIALSIHSEKRFVEGMLQAGAAGYILKESAPEDLLKGVQAVLSGKSFLSPAVASIVLSQYREKQEQTPESVKATIDIIETKLHHPAIPEDHIHRGNLIEMLTKNQDLPLTIVSAPAGYGKSTLVSCWLHSSHFPNAWVSLDDSDNDLRLFLRYFIGAIQTIFPNTCSGLLSLMNSSSLPPIQRLAGLLANELDLIEEDFIMVLDDIHLIKNKSIHDLFTEVLRHPPHPMRLVLIGRSDPFLPLASLRARRLVVEIRAQHLRFTEKETKLYLEQTMKEEINDSTAIAWTEKTEGWITGLRLAALSMLQRDNRSTLLDEMQQGGSQYILEYLFNEVLARQPPERKEYLLKTVILDRFSAPLCDAVCQADGDEGQVEMDGWSYIRFLKKENLFLVSLDEEGYWFRFHHLFQHLLQNQLKRHYYPEKIAGFHFRAGEWFASQGLITEAIDHMLAAGDHDRAAEIIEANRDEEFFADRWFVVDQWLAMLPAEVKRVRPKLLLTEAWITNLQHHIERVPKILEQVELLLRGQSAEPTLLGELAFFHGYFAYWNGQAESCRQFNEEALSKLSGKRSPFLGEAELMLGLARCMAGEKELAVRALESKIDEVDSSEGQFLSRLIASLVFIHLVSGDLPRALDDAQRLQLTADKFDMPLTQAWSAYMLACSQLHTGDLEDAMHHFARAYEMRYMLEPMAALDALAGLALAQQLMRLDDEARETVNRLEEFARDLKELQLLPMVHSCCSRISLLRGDVESAVKRAQRFSNQPIPANLFMWLESPSITQARVLIASGSEESLQKATSLLREIRRQSDAYHITCQTIEVAVLQSLVLERQGSHGEALTVLNEAVNLAAPGRWIRPFVEQGNSMVTMLKKLRNQADNTTYIDEILAAFKDERDADTPATTNQQVEPFPSTSSQPLVVPLTTREIEIMELVASRLYNKEIADNLFISTETVKSHLKNIYAKLEVGSRREAVSRARELGIFSNVHQ